MTTSMASLDAQREEAIADLRRLVEVDDTLYKPAQFLLATTLLDIGDAGAAQPLFAELMRPAEERAIEIFKQLAEQWPQTGLRWSRLARRIPGVQRWLQPWLALWQEMRVALTGGIVHLYGKWWKDLRRELDTPVAPDGRLSLAEFRAAIIDTQVGLFDGYPVIHEYVRIAAGKLSGRVSAERAREILDALLDESAIRRFDLALQQVAFAARMAKVDTTMRSWRARKEDAGSDPSTLPEALADGRKELLAHLYEPGLDRIAGHWRAQRWDDVNELAELIRRETRPPNEYAAAQLLRQATLPRRQARWIRMFLPALGFLDRWREAFRDSLYLESAYGKHLADYLTGRDEDLKNAAEGAALLAERLERPGTPGLEARRAVELRTLALCIASDATVRYVMSAPGRESGAFTLRHGYESTLAERVAGFDRRLRSAVSTQERVAALRSLGLIARFLGSNQVIPTVKLPLDEVAYLEQALEAGESAETYFCLAERLERNGDRVSAGRFLARALGLAPRHVRARALADHLGPADPGATV